jgi:hypothetical protein
MKYYKILVKGKSCHGGSANWGLPKDGRPGVWMPPITGKLKACERGYHVVKDKDILEWLKEDCQIFEAEPKGEVSYADNKGVCRSARLTKPLKWDDRIARSFACDCAERVLPIFEKAYPNDKRPRAAIEIARQFIGGTVSSEQLWAARDAARDAAWAAAGAAAWDAAWAAAGAAAWDARAAGAAAWDAAGAAEKKWQTKQLMKYLYGKIKV